MLGDASKGDWVNWIGGSLFSISILELRQSILIVVAKVSRGIERKDMVV